ncbi:MAG: Mur ligase family protein [Candidatus Taylorbacteria bacterium]
MKSILKQTIVYLLTLEAKLVLKKYKPKIVGITGSVGKTSTKDAIYSVLATQFFVRKSEKSFNSEIGVPLTILGARNGWGNPFIWLANLLRGLGLIIFPFNYPDWLVIEIGADRPLDIKTLASWVKPDIAVITRIGNIPVHVEFFTSRAQLIEEKSYLARYMKEGGTLIVNGDDADAVSFIGLTKNKSLTVSLEGEGDVVASHSLISYRKQENGEEVPVGINFKANLAGSSVPVNLTGVLGIQHVYPSLFAIAIGLSQNLNILTLCEAISGEIKTPGRMKILPGIKNTIIIDDTYNSSPVALSEALKTLLEISVKKRKIAILGDMMELGAHSKDEHLHAGKLVASVAHILITVGIRARDIAEGAQLNGMSEKNVFQFDDAKDSFSFLDGLLIEGDIVLVKGSQSVRMEKIVEEIMEHPEDKEKLLVRQDREWRRR